METVSGKNLYLLKLINNSSKSQPLRRFGYPFLISVDFDEFGSPLTP